MKPVTLIIFLILVTVAIVESRHPWYWEDDIGVGNGVKYLKLTSTYLCKLDIRKYFFRRYAIRNTDGVHINRIAAVG